MGYFDSRLALIGNEDKISVLSTRNLGFNTEPLDRARLTPTCDPWSTDRNLRTSRASP